MAQTAALIGCGVRHAPFANEAETAIERDVVLIAEDRNCDGRRRSILARLGLGVFDCPARVAILLAELRGLVFPVVDDCTRECLALIADTSLSSVRVTRELDAIMPWRGKPAAIVSDNGTELASNAILDWAESHKVEWHYISTRQADAEWLCRELQRPPAG